ncbi:MAG: hypothetical protein WAX48_17095, partial [Desulfosalsimonadaceae bacterium]
MKTSKAMTIVLFLFCFMLVIPVSVFAGSMPDTGQTKCYDNTKEITCPQPGQNFYGQDSQYNGPARSYTKKNGTVWPVDPNPIPITYVTKAGQLWKLGETYVYAASAGDPPLCWVSASNKAVKFAKMDAPSSTAICDMPPFYTAGEVFAVTIIVTPASEVSVYAIEDLVPADWTVSNISDSGSFDAMSHKVKFGPFMDHSSRNLTYDITPPVCASGSYAFSGVASFDGNNVAISGIREIAVQPAPKLTDIIKGLQILAGVDVDISNSLVDANGDGKVEMKDVLENLLKSAFFSPCWDGGDGKEEWFESWTTAPLGQLPNEIINEVPSFMSDSGKWYYNYVGTPPPYTCNDISILPSETGLLHGDKLKLFAHATAFPSMVCSWLASGAIVFQLPVGFPVKYLMTKDTTFSGIWHYTPSIDNGNLEYDIRGDIIISLGTFYLTYIHQNSSSSFEFCSGTPYPPVPGFSKCIAISDNFERNIYNDFSVMYGDEFVQWYQDNTPLTRPFGM